MKVKAKQLSDGEWQFFELDEVNRVRELKSVRGGTISMGFREKSEIRVHVDLITEEVMGKLVPMCSNKDGELKQIKEIVFADGTVDKYMGED